VLDGDDMQCLVASSSYTPVIGIKRGKVYSDYTADSDAIVVTPDDARLIAAAPDLLEALHEIIAINDERHEFRKRRGTHRGLSMVVAEAAIAKAEGKK
jgi:hypothetical protein